MQNKLLNKYLLPSYVAAVLFVCMAGTATFIAAAEGKTVKENPEKEDLVDRAKTTSFICLLIVVISLIMAVFSGVKYPLVINEKTKFLTRHYLHDVFVNHPELKQYRFILEDPKAMKEIAALVCNGLSESEQKEILNLVSTELSKVNHLNRKSKLRELENDIIAIVNKHTAKNPEHMNKVLLAIASTTKPDIAETAQKVR